MNSGNMIFLAICTLIVALLFFAVLSNPSRWNQKPQRGTAPGKGNTKKTIDMHFGSQSGGHQFTMSHTKDPQKHAQGMIPAKARKKDPTK